MDKKVKFGKKDQSLRLCIDNRKINNKTIPDRHPIPKVQYMPDILRGEVGNGDGNSSSLPSIGVRHTTKDVFTQIEESIQRSLPPGSFRSLFGYPMIWQMLHPVFTVT